MRELGKMLVMWSMTALLMLAAVAAPAQSDPPEPGAPPEGVACVVSAGNRVAPLRPDGSYAIFGIPGNLGATRARATCADGSVGQSAIQFTNPNTAATIELGPIIFGQLDEVPLAVTLNSATRYLTTGADAQLQATAVDANGIQRDVTARTEGTVYAISNELLATVTDGGLVHIYPQFAPGSSSRVVVSATTEGSVSATYMFILGPRGTLTGTVWQPDGTTPVSGAEVSVLRLQPMEQAGTAITGADGRFALAGVNAGTFVISAINPTTGDRALIQARIETEGQSVDVALRLNGLGRVDVTVLDALDAPVANTEVTFTALGMYRDVRTLATNASGVASFVGVAAGDFTVSARNPVTRLIGTAVAQVAPGEVKPITLKLQPIGEIRGRVFDVDGTTLRAGVQVRIVSRERGIITQGVTAADGRFAFDTLPTADSPYTLDAFVDGRLRARVPGVVLSAPNQILERDIVLAPVGVVRGHVVGGGGFLANTAVTLQSLEGLRLTFETRSDAQGAYSFPAVPVGDFELLATAPNGQSGRAQGRVDNDAQVVDIDVAIADDTLVGVVYQRDGVTPVGAGVNVYLAAKALGSRYTYEGLPNIALTQTDAEGRFGFTVTAAGIYFAQAEQGLERGRTEVVVVNLNPSQPLQARVVFLAKGTVSGVVRDVNGVPQVDVPVTVRSDGAFTLERATRTGANGAYAITGVFAGDLVAAARNPTTELAGQSTGRLIAEGDAISLDITLAATATISGRVLRRAGAVVAGPVKVSLRRDGTVLATREFVTGASYSFDLVPVGNIELTAEELSNGDKGIATTRVAAANDDKQIDIRLVGQGSLGVTLVNETGQPVVGAKVTASTDLPFQRSEEQISDASGHVAFERVFAGDYRISASKQLTLGALGGSANGTLLPDTHQDLQITMSTLIIGGVEGTVFGPDGVTPAAAGLVVRMLPEPFRDAFVTTLDADGKYTFANVPAGTYAVDVLRFYTPNSCPARDRTRGRTVGIQVQTQGQVANGDVQLIGSGVVRGQVTNALGQAVSGIDVRMTNPDPVYGQNITCGAGTTYNRTTDASGNYRIDDAPPGDFTIVAENSARTFRAEGRGRVRFDGDEVVVDLELVDSAVTMPSTLHDANGFRFDVLGNGAIGNGTRNVFAGAAPDTGGMRLEIVRDGIAVPFTNGNGSVGRLGKSGQQIDVDDVTPSGLLVTRQVFVPRAGYFTRYLEVLENPGAVAVTVDVRLKSHHSVSNANPRVVDSSDGDQILTIASASQRDRWVIIDDQQDADPFASSSIPATGHLFDGVDATTQVGSASYQLIGQTGRLNYQWNGITVPAGGKVVLMHFAFNQLTRFTAREAAMRLSQLPPEAIDDLTTDERLAVQNFVVPETSALAPLPNLDAGRIDGRVFSGDGVSPIAGANVRFKSKHPLFGRVRNKTTNASGHFEFHSTLDGSINNYVIPVFGYDLSATYSQTGAASASTPGDFDPESVTDTQDLIFVGQGDVRGLVKRHGGALVANAAVSLCRLNDRFTCSDVLPRPSNSATSAADGSYAMFANTPRDYFLFAAKAHPQNSRYGGARPIYGEGSVTITAGDTAVANVTMEQTGSISGVVRAADNTPVVGAYVDLYLLIGGSPQLARGTRTDTAGRFSLVDVPVGAVRLVAEDAVSHAAGSVDANISVDTESVADITLRPFGAAHVQVNYARGATAGGAVVRTNYNGAQYATDSNGRVTIQLPEGTHALNATHPDNNNLVLRGSGSAVIATPGQQVDVVLTLGPAGSVFGSIVRPDGTTLANGFPYVVRQIGGLGQEAREARQTGNTGAFRENGLPVGRYLIMAFDAAQDRYADAEFDVVADGEQVQVDLVLLENRIALPADLRDANRFRFDVQRSGALNQGSGSFDNAAVALEVNGQAYVGETSARLEAQRRQFLISQPALIDGVRVSRRIYVPRGAYYARYLEIFENAGSEARTLQVQLQSTLQPTGAVATSDGDVAVSTSDRWVSFDDAVDEDILLADNQVAPTAFVFGGAGAALAATSVVLDAPANRPRLTQRWNSLEVPAGGRVVLMHFVAQQINRAGIAAAAQRLVQLPPEVLAELDPADRAAIVNFVVPTDEQPTAFPLPTLTGRIGGIAQEGDERTPVPGANITMQSTHPLFNRIWGMAPDPWCPPGTVVGSLRSTSSVPQGGSPLGSFALQGQLTALDSIALPEGVPVRMTVQEARSCFGGGSGHPQTYVPSRVDFAPPTTNRNVVWDTGILTGTVVGAADLAITSGRVFRSIDDPDPYVFMYVPIASDGTYVYPGLPPGQYDLLFDTHHPDAHGADVLRGQRQQVTVALGQITVTDVMLQPTGGVQGAVVTSTGEQSVGARLTLAGLAAGQNYDQCADGCVAGTLAKHRGKRAVHREVTTDSLGRYAFAAIPVGEYTLTVIDPISDGRLTFAVTVSANQTTVRNVTLAPLGRVELTVNSANGTPVADAYAYLYADAQGFEEVAGRTNGLGRLTIANIPQGGYRIRVRDPRFQNAVYLERSVTGTIVTQGQVDPHTLQLRAVAGLAIHVIDSGSGGNSVSGAAVALIDARGTSELGSTNASGNVGASAVPDGAVAVRARARIANVDREGIVNISVVAADDNQVRPVTVDLAQALVPLPKTLHDANRRGYNVQRDGAGGEMPELAIDGVAFTGAANASQQFGQRQYTIEQVNPLSGLKVTRRIHVPRNGYFARYLEVLENPGAAAVVVDVTLTAPGGYNDRVHATSSGDEEIGNDGSDRDRWFTTGYCCSSDEFDVYAHVAGAAGAAQADAELSHGYDGNYGTDVARMVWNDVSVPAGGRVVLMHFISHQSNAASAIAAAQRLTQLPPEVLEALVDEPSSGIVTHVVPANGQSVLPALPSLLGRVHGNVREGDGSPVAGARVSARSTHPLFNRIWTTQIPTLTSDAAGLYDLVGVLRDDDKSLPVPVDSDVVLEADHPHSNQLANATAALAASAGDVTQDLQFASGQLVGHVLGGFQYPQVDAAVRVYSGNVLVADVDAAVDGSYRIGGLATGSYRVRATFFIAEGTDLSVETTDLQIVAGQTTTRDFVLPATGALHGVLRTAAGALLANARVEAGNGDYARAVYTDAQGRFALNALPVGPGTLEITDPRTSAETQSAYTVTADQQLDVQVTLPATGTLNLTTRFARGALATGVHVYLAAPSIIGERYLGRSNGSGILTATVPAGTFSVFAHHPETNERSDTTAQIDSDGQVLALDAMLRPSARLLVTVTESGSAVPGARVRVHHAVGSGGFNGTTNAIGQFTSGHLMAQRSIVTAATDGALALAAYAVDASVDGQLLPIELALGPASSSAGVLAFASERHLHSVELNAGERFTLGVYGATVSGVAPVCYARAQVYAPNGSLVADGYGAGPSGFEQANLSGDLGNIVAATSGRYLIVVQRYTNWCTTGGYRLAGLRDGTAATLSRDVGGGSVVGRVLQADGVTPVADAIVRLRAWNAPGSYEQQRSDASGAFAFATVLLGGFELAYHAIDGQAAQVLYSGTLATPGQQVMHDLVLPATTTLDIQVLGDGGTPIQQPVQINLQSAQLWINRHTDETGHLIYSYVGNSAVTVSATRPEAGTVRDHVVVQPANGQTIPVTLRLAAGTVSGVVADSVGVAIQGVYVEFLAAQNQSVAGASTDAVGHYQSPLLAAAQPLRVRARDPQNYVVVSEAVQPVAGSDAVRDLVLPAHAHVDLHVVAEGGAPMPDVNVSAEYQPDLDEAGFTTYGWTYTNADGDAHIDELPIGRPIKLVAEYYGGGGERAAAKGGGGNYLRAEAMVTLTTAGERTLVELAFDLPGGSVRATAAAADGEPVEGTCYLIVEPGNGDGDYVSGDCNQPLLFNGLPAGAHVATFYGDNFYESDIPVTVVDDEIAEMEVPISVVRGELRYADSTTVPNGYVEVVGVDDATHYGRTDNQGDYRVLDVAVGAIRLHAYDDDSGLRIDATDSLADAGVPETVNLTLPQSGSILGTVRDAAATPLAGAQVYALSTGLDAYRNVETNALGQYRIDHIALGTINVAAIKVGTGNLGSGATVLANDGQAATLDIDLPVPGAVSGSVRNADSTPAQSACVNFTSRVAGFGHSDINLGATTSADGAYAFAEVLPGPYAVIAHDCNYVERTAGIADGSVASSAATTTDVSIGNAFLMTHPLADTVSGYTVHVNGDGSIQPALMPNWWNSVFDQSPALRVDGMYYPYRIAGRQAQDGRRIDFGPDEMDGLKVSRQIYVPPAAGYARIVEVFHNDGATPVSRPLRIVGAHASGELLLESAPAPAGRFAIQRSSTESGEYTPGIAGYVFSGAGVSTATTTDFMAGRRAFNYGWTLDIAPGESVRFVHYVVMRLPGQASAVEAQAQSLANMTEPGMFEGMSNSERAQVRNFMVPMQ